MNLSSVQITRPLALATMLVAGATLQLGSPAAASAAPVKAKAKHACAKRSHARGCKRIPRHSAHASIIGGYNPHPSQWPWIVRVDPMKCGGTLIRPNVVLTAAHCVTNNDGSLEHFSSPIQVTLGRRTMSDTAHGEVIRVDAVRVHPSYHGEPYSNDVALLHLSHASSQTPAALGDAADWRNPATVMGWGRTNVGPSGSQSDVLHAVDLQLNSDATCAAHTPGRAAYVPAVNLCAGGTGTGTCKGDSGGPLMVGDGQGGGWELIGVVSYGDPDCNANGTPSYFAWAAGPTLRPWIVATGDALATLQVQSSSPAPAGDRTAPEVMTMLMWPSRFKAARRGPGIASKAVGTTVRYRVSEASRVTFTVKRCVSRKGCARKRRIGKLAHGAKAGMNRLGFTGRVAGKRLSPGRYRLIARARDGAGNGSVKESIAFRIVG
jgi:secreted trypsin-like serine protease